MKHRSECRIYYYSKSKTEVVEIREFNQDNLVGKTVQELYDKHNNEDLGELDHITIIYKQLI